MGSLGRRDSLAMLEAAWDAGIRHFDVAPMYGYGEAESCLGEFLRRHPTQVTVTTKFGIPAEGSRPLARAARAVLRPVVHRFPGLKVKLSRARARSSPATAERAAVKDYPAPPRDPNPIFNAPEARRSLERSLKALGRDHIDVWLLHEVAARDLVDDGLLRLLEDSVQSGVIGTYGAGTEGAQIPDLLGTRPEYCPTLQYEWSIFDPVPSETPAFRIHHRALTSNFTAIRVALERDRRRCSRWSEATGVDLADSRTLAKLMLKAALVLNPHSVVLFSSKDAKHIRDNVALAEDDRLVNPARMLYEIAQQERVSREGI